MNREKYIEEIGCMLEANTLEEIKKLHNQMEKAFDKKAEKCLG